MYALSHIVILYSCWHKKKQVKKREKKRKKRVKKERRREKREKKRKKTWTERGRQTKADTERETKESELPLDEELAVEIVIVSRYKHVNVSHNLQDIQTLRRNTVRRRTKKKTM